MTVLVPVIINADAVTQAAQQGHAGPLIFMTAGLTLSMIGIPALAVATWGAPDSAVAWDRFKVYAPALMVFVFGGASIACAVAAHMGIRL